MGKLYYSLMFTLMMIGLSFIHSCFKTDDNRIMYPTALVTVKPDIGNTSFYLQLNETTVLNPVNMKQSPFGSKEVRALANYREATEEEIAEASRSDISEQVYVNWLDSIRTKPMVPHLGELEDDEAYGDDPVEIIGDWLTVVEDGYLTLRFRTLWGDGMIHHVNLVYGADPEDPFHLVFHHDAKGDLDGRFGDALVAFKLNGLPDSGEQPQEITLEWQSFDGEKTVKLKCSSRDEVEDNKAEAFTTEELVKSIY